MTLHIRDEETDRLVRRLAQRRGVGLTEAIRTAVANELAREQVGDPPRASLRDRLAPLRDRVRAAGPTGLEADKAFYDRLSERE